jgi:hypothetical protein
LNLNCTLSPNLEEENFEISTKKQPSPLTNPASQFGSGIDWSRTLGLSTGIISEKAFFNGSDKPQLIDALTATIFFF